MATYLIRDDEGNAHVTEFGKPTPAHALTKSAKAARRSVRDAAAERRQRITRADVEAAYVHPAPEVPAREVVLSGKSPQLTGRRYLVSLGARSLWKLAEANGHRVKATYNRGTTLPKWHVNSPDNKTNPGPPVDASQYHGEVVDVETVYVVVQASAKTWPHGGRRIRGVWQNGKLDRIEVDGVETTLRAAREVLS